MAHFLRRYLTIHLALLCLMASAGIPAIANHCYNGGSITLRPTSGVATPGSTVSFTIEIVTERLGHQDPYEHRWSVSQPPKGVTVLLDPPKYITRENETVRVNVSVSVSGDATLCSNNLIGLRWEATRFTRLGRVEPIGPCFYYYTLRVQPVGPPDIVVNRTTIDLGVVPCGQRKNLVEYLSVANRGGDDLLIQSVRLVGGSSSAFSLSNFQQVTYPYALRPCGTLYPTITFAPKVGGEFHDYVELQSNDPDEPLVRVLIVGRSTCAVQAQFQAADGTPLPAPLRVGITRRVNRAQRLRLLVTPATEVNSFDLRASDRLALSDVSRDSNGLIWFNLVGTRRSSPGDGGDWISAIHRSGQYVITHPVSVRVPAQIASQHDVLGDGMERKNVILTNYTSPTARWFYPTPLTDIQGVLATLYVRRLRITVLDQFGETVGDLYEGAEVSENGLSINSPLRRDSTYVDPVGFASHLGVVTWSSLDELLALVSAWSNRPLLDYPAPEETSTDTPVEVDGHPLDIGVRNRRARIVKSSGSYDVIITWPAN